MNRMAPAARIGLCSIIILASFAASQFAHAQIQGGTSENLRCYWGLIGATKEETGADPLKEGEQCGTKKVPCEDGEEGEIISRCKSGKCVATESCGKPLEDKPYEIPDSAPQQPDTQPALTPSTGGIENPIPSSPTPSTPGSGGTGGTGSGSSNPDVLPPIDVVQNPTPTAPPNTVPTKLPGWQGGSTFSSPSVVTPTPGRGGFESGGVYSGGNPFTNPSGTTFTGSWGASSAGSTFNFFSAFAGFANFFSGLWGGGGSGESAQQPVAPQPEQDLNGRAEEVLRRFQARPDVQEAARRAEAERTKMIEDALKLGAPSPFQTSQDRTGLPAPGEKTLQEIVRDMEQPMNPRLPPSVIQEENVPQPSSPRGENPAPVQVAEVGGGMTDVSPPLPTHPEWWTPQMENAFVAGIGAGLSPQDAATRAENEFVEGVFAGLNGGRLSSGASDVGIARRILQEEVATAERALENKYMTQALPFYEYWDTFIQLSPEQQALRAAEGRLSLLADAEGRARLGQSAGTLEPSVMTPAREFAIAPGVIVKVSNEPATFDTKNAIDLLDYGPLAVGQKGINAVRNWWNGTAATPATPEPTSGLIGGLSAMGERVRNATRMLANRFGFGSTVPQPVSVPPVSSGEFSGSESETLPSTITREPIPTPTPTPQSTPQPQPSPTSAPAPAPVRDTATPTPTPAPASPSDPPQASSGSGFVQGSMSLFSSLLNSIASFFRSTPETSTPQPAAPQPSVIAASASIAANPSSIDDGETTELSWSSVGTLSCAVVDSGMKTIVQNGPNGKIVSSALMMSTRFGVICDIENGNDKFINETLVRVNGDESDPDRIFAQIGRASSAAPVSSSGTDGPSGGAQGASGAEAPVDVRTCDPDQSMDTFIKCLCEAEPNPSGCAIPPGGN